MDNHTTARQGIRRILDKCHDIQVVGEAEDGLAAVDQAALLQRDVVLLDLHMPKLSGIETLPRLRAAYAHVEVVVLTMFDQDDQVFASLKAGARGYVHKDAAQETIITAAARSQPGRDLLPAIMAPAS